MTFTSHDVPDASARVLALLHVEDLEDLRERSKMLSVKESTDLLIPVVAAMAESDDDGAAQRDVQPALGVALYQSLIRERLAGPSMDVAIAQMMAGKHKKPRELDASIPRALEAVIMRATRERPEERFANLHDLGAALLPSASKQVRQTYGAEFPGHGSSVQAVLLRRLEHGEDLKLLAAALAIALPFVVASRQNDDRPAPAPVVTASAASASSALLAAREPALEVPSAPEAPTPSAEPERTVPEPERARAESAPDSPVASATVPRTYPIDVVVEPSTAWIMLDEKAAGRGRLRRELPRDGKKHALHVGAPGYQVQALHFTDAPPPASVVLAKRVR